MSEFNFVYQLLQIKPKSLTILTNCKYTEIAIQYPLDNQYTYIYFLQEKKTSIFKYVGYLNNTIEIDPSFKE